MAAYSCVKEEECADLLAARVLWAVLPSHLANFDLKRGTGGVKYSIRKTGSLEPLEISFDSYSTVRSRLFGSIQLFDVACRSTRPATLLRKVSRVDKCKLSLVGFESSTQRWFKGQKGNSKQ